MAAWMSWLRCCGLLSCVAVVMGCQRGVPINAPATLEVSIGEERFTMELALTAEARFQGLSDRTSVAADGGMLFAFPDARVMSFVMRRCVVPIDVVFVGPNARVLSVHAMRVEPDPDAADHLLMQYPSVYPAQFALEFAGGTAERLKIMPGQKIDIPVESLKGWAR